MAEQPSRPPPSQTPIILNPLGKTFMEIVEFLPLLVFGYMSSRSEAGLEESFFIGGSLAIVVLIIHALFKRRMNPLALAANFFLLVNAAVFQVYIPGLAEVLSYLQESTLFIVILAVGLATTLRSPNGFVWARAKDPKVIKTLSYALLVIALGALVASFVFKGEHAYSAAIPFIVLFVLQKIFGAYIIARESEAP